MKRLAWMVVVLVIICPSICGAWSFNDFTDEYKSAVDDVIANDSNANGIPDTADTGGTGAETDPVTGSVPGIVKANGSGTISAAIPMTDYMIPFNIYGTAAWQAEHGYAVGATFTALEEGGSTSYRIVHTGFTSDATYDLTGKETANSYAYYISPAAVSGSEDAFTGWDKDASDDFAWDFDYTDLINKPSIPSYTFGTGLSEADNHVVCTVVDTNTTYTSSDFDIKDLTDSTNLRTAWSGKQDALGFTPEPAFDFGTGAGDINTDDIPAGSTNLYEQDSGTNTGDEPDASPTVKGIIEIADDTEALAGTDTGKAVTPAGVKIYVDANGSTGIDIVTVTESGTLTAEQLTGSRIEYTGAGTSTFTIGSASDAYMLSQGATTFIFLATEGAYFDPAAGDKITYIDDTIHTLDDGDKLAALTPAKYDAFTIRPVKDGTDYQWLIHCSTGTYEDGGP